MKVFPFQLESETNTFHVSFLLQHPEVHGTVAVLTILLQLNKEVTAFHATRIAVTLFATSRR
jgi:uncharacterized membrane protein